MTKKMAISCKHENKLTIPFYSLNVWSVFCKDCGRNVRDEPMIHRDQVGPIGLGSSLRVRLCSLIRQKTETIEPDEAVVAIKVQ